MKTKIYRVDDYYRNAGDLVGFFLTKEEAESETEFTTSCDVGDGTFSQIIEFEVDSDVLKGIDLADNEAMLSERIWGSGDILNEFYYK